MDLRIFLRSVWANAIVIVVAAIITAGLAFTVSNALPRSYVAVARLVVQSGLGLAGSGTDDVLAAPRVGQTYAVLATTRPVLEDVIERADLPYDPEELMRHIGVSASLDTPIVTITMTETDPGVAALAANAMAAAIVDMASDQSADGAPIELLRIVESATPPDDFSSPRPLFNTLLSGTAMLVAQLALLAAIIYLREGRSEITGERSG